jgi:hypothetical protein
MHIRPGGQPVAGSFDKSAFKVKFWFVGNGDDKMIGNQKNDRQEGSRQR